MRNDVIGVCIKKSRSLTVHHQVLSVDLDLALEAVVGGVIFEHVDHVVQGDERVVDGHNLKHKTYRAQCNNIEACHRD